MSDHNHKFRVLDIEPQSDKAFLIRRCEIESCKAKEYFDFGARDKMEDKLETLKAVQKS